MSSGTAQDLRAAGAFSVDAGLSITTAKTTTLPYRLSNDDAMKIARGVNWRYAITWYSEGDNPLDLSSSYTAAFTVRAGATGDVLVSLTNGSGITLGSGQGNILLELADTATAALSFVRGWAQLTLHLPDGRFLRLVEGFCDLVG